VEGDVFWPKREIHIYHHGRVHIDLHSDQPSEQLDQIKSMLQNIIQMETKMAGELDVLEAAVAEQTTVIDSAIVLLDQIKALLDAAIASGDPVRIAAVSTLIADSKIRLAEAVVRNTPAAP
jgi:hypothetical protein